MSKSTTTRWAWVAVLVLVSACGGKVADDDDDDGGAGDGSTGAASHTSTSGNGTGNGTGDGNASATGGALCAGTTPHHDYNLCYTTTYPPCLTLNAPTLPSVLGTDRVPTIGPWVGTNEACKMVCCYGAK